MVLRCHDLCLNAIEFEREYGLRRRTQGTWDTRWKGHHVYSDTAGRYCSVCGLFFMLIVGKGGIKSEEDAVTCPCCKCKLRTTPRNRKDRQRRWRAERKRRRRKRRRVLAVATTTTTTTTTTATS